MPSSPKAEVTGSNPVGRANVLGVHTGHMGYGLYRLTGEDGAEIDLLMPSTSIWKTITEDRLDDQEAPEARLAAHASWRTSARGDFAGARSAQDGDRQAARRF